MPAYTVSRAGKRDIMKRITTSLYVTLFTLFIATLVFAEYEDMLIDGFTGGKGYSVGSLNTQNGWTVTNGNEVNVRPPN
jgi:hemolysin activation/secretion protein